MSMTGPPGGPKTDIDPVRAAESNTGMILGVLTVFHVIALTFVALRVYARAVVIKTFGKDDICMVLSAGYWNPAVKPKCYPIPLFVTFALVNTGFNIFTDVLFATFPIPIIWTLKMKRKLKVYLIAILSLGYFAVAMGIVKSVYQIAFARMPDKTFNQSIQFWGFLQLQLGIIAACATSLKPLFSRILKLNTTDRYYNTPGGRYGYGSHSRGNRMTGRGYGAGTGTGGNTGTGTGTGKQASAHEYELETARGSADDGNLSNGKGETYSTATSFYKHGSAEGSGSEEMILGAAPGTLRLTPPPHAVISPEAAARGIVRTTEVRVSVK
ncbi:hypothetical protein CHGG_10079 [Chaetomium globosum CBS 148.51]|uniref:Rhodopsin domain-containing protein n=1 Tax=Chaetomium globosum (strain ATCC 6205 / CBS 148.51 / DSM 1962 / NBRC 6347 / NRRL 1970) TaxID=306901 RepID=Q2GPM5_CHAGB|nr:uncharacterized protein CHGG_10079 [Chaetomium globosum CBS 148.51]EAQ83675.1 hypothetical protein CHGG_10079 [Chaetomium globosum CBS 148.51]